MNGLYNSKCVLVTGASAGIGRSLALAIASLPTNPKVIAVGRRKNRLEELEKSKLDTIQFDLDADKAALKNFVDDLLQRYPDLDTVITCAGVQHEFYFTEQVDVDKLTSEMNLNYISTVTIISFIMPHFLKLANEGRPCYFIPVTSGLGIVPAPHLLNYSASKAALHSFCTSLQIQLRGTNVHVLEIIPPLVESELHDAYGTTEKLSKFWMPLDEYTKITMSSLLTDDLHISTGTAQEAFRHFEAGKYELAEKLWEMSKQP